MEEPESWQGCVCARAGLSLVEVSGTVGMEVRTRDRALDPERVDMDGAGQLLDEGDGPGKQGRKDRGW